MPYNALCHHLIDRPRRCWSFLRLFAAGIIIALIAGLLIGSDNSVIAADSTTNPLIYEMIEQVQSEVVYTYTSGLTGEWPVLVSGQPYQILTRSTQAVVPIGKAVLFMGEQMQSYGLRVSNNEWVAGYLSGENVIGELTGENVPDEIILLTAHLDNSPWVGYAPGADDNASGCVAVLMAAHILSQYRFSRTVRFAFFTGEEEGLLGSRAYAASLASSKEKVIAVLNMDMIGWNTTPEPIVRLHTRGPSSSGYIDDNRIANQFSQIIEDYGLSGQIVPVVDPDATGNSDHVSFWGVSYPAILVSEDSEEDFNRYYHSVNDRVSELNLSYFTGIIKAVVGTAAQLAGLEGQAEETESVRLMPPIDQQWAKPGEQVVFTLHLTNTGTSTGLFALNLTRNAWESYYPMDTITLSPGVETDIPITVTIPSTVPDGTSDFISIALVSHKTGRLLDTALLATVTQWNRIYLPVIKH